MAVDQFLMKARTALALGLPNLARVAMYRGQIRLGRGAAALGDPPMPHGPLFQPRDGEAAEGAGWPAATVTWFDWHTETVPANAAPDWHRNPFNGVIHSGRDRPWFLLPDFDAEAGDIKGFWELSRFGWAVKLAVAARAGGAVGAAARRRLDGWLQDWIVHNPAYRGPNWKCGQEASLRVLHLAMAAHILGEARKPAPALAALIRLHLRRIAPTIHYALAQDNNHGTSEAAALWLGGHWLAAIDRDAESRRWAAQGQRWLENRARRLIGPDGSFSQYSVNYHRLMLDTLSIVEIWRRAYALPAFSATFAERAAAAAHWLRAMTDPQTGDAPVLGANDGARLMPLDSAYRDHRPSVQLACALFCEARAYPERTCDSLAAALNIAVPSADLPAPASARFDDGGYAVLRAGNAVAFVRYPRHRFRPGHADALHVDLWLNGANLLRDGGTFGYHVSPEERRYFAGAPSHNTVEFDGRDQMPRLSRFLFGAWTQATEVSPVVADAGGAVTFSAAYRDWRGATHRRAVRLTASELIVTDTIAGFEKQAMLRWRLQPGDWRIDGRSIIASDISLTVEADRPSEGLRLADGLESRHYLRQTPLPVAEIAFAEPATIVSTIRWRA
ncbi:MAG: heparinase II/III family protein [Beijerinckiaceae bacterium]